MSGGDTNETIHVRETGLTLGWRVVVVLSAAVLGIYVATQVAPLRNDIDSHQRTILQYEKRITKLEEKLQTLTAEGIRSEGREAIQNRRLEALEGTTRDLGRTVQGHELHHATAKKLVGTP